MAKLALVNFKPGFYEPHKEWKAQEEKLLCQLCHRENGLDTSIAKLTSALSSVFTTTESMNGERETEERGIFCLFPSSYACVNPFPR